MGTWRRPESARARLFSWLAITVLLLVVGGPTAASAQEPAGARWFVSLDGGIQTTKLADILTQPITFEQFAEEGEVTREVSIDRLPTIAISGGVHLWRNLGFRAGFLRFRRNDDAELSWNVPLGSRMHVQLFGGPTVYFAAIDVAGVQTGDEEYPFEDTPIDGVVKFERNPKALGWTAGADVSIFFSRHIGFGWLARFSRATTEVSLPQEGFFSQLLDRPVSTGVDLWGALFSAGVRFRF